MATRRRRDVEEDFTFNREEVENLTKAVKDEKFRQLLREYADEMTDPKNVAQYEKEITQLEKERGVDVTFLRPNPCYVMKTSVNGEKKAFINVSTNENIGRPTCERGVEGDKRGFQWAIPYSLAPAREDFDKERRYCVVYDVLFHPETVHMAKKNPRFKKLVENTALDGIENNYNVKLDGKNVRYPRMKFKGIPVSTVIRRKNSSGSTLAGENGDFHKFPPQAQYDVIHEKDENLFDPKKFENQKKVTTKEDDVKYTTPKYVLKHRNEIQMEDFAYQPTGQVRVVNNLPSELVVEIELPLISSSNNVDLDVMEKKLKLQSRSPAAYLLELQLPHPVDKDETRATFDSSKRKLIITLPVKKMARNDNLVMNGNDDEKFAQNDNLVVNGNGNDNLEEKVMSNGKSQSEMLDERTKSDDDSDDDKVEDKVNNNDNDNESQSDTRIFVPKSEIYSTLPLFKVRQTDEKVIFVFEVFNVEPESVEIKMEDDKRSVGIKLTSLGSGFVPCYYAVVVESADGKRFDQQEEIRVEVGESNVVVHLEKGEDSCGDWQNVLVGLDADHLEKIALVTLSSVVEHLEEMQREIDEEEKNAGENEMSVTVTEMSEKHLQLEVGGYKELKELKQENKENKSSVSSNVNANGQKSKSKPIPIRRKQRSLSETSADFSPSHCPRSILKTGRLSRSLSESSEDANFLTQDEILSAPDGNIPEESSADEENSARKSVRFNDVVSRNLYRSNSSILGQRKKNQRKQKLKKRAAQRRASESEGSETDDVKNAAMVNKKRQTKDSKKDNERTKTKDNKKEKETTSEDEKTDKTSRKGRQKKEKNVQVLNPNPPVISIQNESQENIGKGVGKEDFVEELNVEPQNQQNPNGNTENVEKCNDTSKKDEKKEEKNIQVVDSESPDPQIENENVENEGVGDENVEENDYKVKSMLSWEEGNTKNIVREDEIKFENTAIFELD